MDLNEALYTTRAMRRVADTSIPNDVLARILDAAVRAPSGGNRQDWRIMVISDESVRDQLGPIYRDAYRLLHDTETDYAGRREAAAAIGDETFLRVMHSGDWLAENFEQVPTWLFFFSKNDPTGASTYPTVWSAMLAARGEGVGTCLTTILGYFKSPEVFELLDVPTDEEWRLAASVSCGYPLGRWGLAKRKPVEDVSFSDRWGQPLGIEVNGPLWS
jgi:nitroreductase